MAAFKAKVALATLPERQPLADLDARQLAPAQITQLEAYRKRSQWPAPAQSRFTAYAGGC